VPLPAGTTAGQVQELVAALNALPSVEVAYTEPRAGPALDWQTLRFQDLDLDGRADACARSNFGIVCVK
jgi:hypothetical protein